MGWGFEVISCLDKDKYAQRLREKNLKHIFGDVFDFIDCALDFTKGKEQYLLDRYSEKVIIGLKGLCQPCRVWCKSRIK